MLEWHDLNARHEATLLWLAAMLIIGIAGSAEARRSVCDLLKMLLEPTISLLIVGLLANVIFLTFIAAIVGREVGLWETLPVVTAIVWALTTGFSLLLHLEVRPESHWPGFALRQSDVLQSYTAWQCM